MSVDEKERDSASTCVGSRSKNEFVRGGLRAASSHIGIEGDLNMVDFSLSEWLGYLRPQAAFRKARKRRCVNTPRIEGLENRTLLTAPVAVDDSYVISEDTTLNATTVLANDTDADNDVIDQAVLVSNVANGSLTLNTNGTFTYTPNLNFNGTDSFTYTAGTSSNGEVSAPATVTITINAVNDVPVVSTVNITTAEDTAVTGTLTATDAENDPITFAEGATAETNGTVAILPDGSFTFTPTANFNGTATFSYVANDGSGNSLEGTVNVTVTAVNDAPVADPQGITTVTEDTAFNGTLTASDADDDTLTFSAGLVTPTNGTLTINPGGTFTYTPNANFNGADAFSFKVNDGSVDSPEALVTLLVNAVNDAPVANAVTINATEDTVFTGTLTATDAEGDPLTFSAGTVAAANGTVTINPDGSFTYTPNANFSGTDSFSFKANDGAADSAEATVTVNVAAVADVPVANPQSITVTEDVAFSGTLTGTDADGDALTFSAGTVAAAHGTVTINPGGTFTYTPNANFSGTDSFSFKVNDGTSDSAEATVSVTVTAVNDLPVVTSATISTTEDTAVNGTLTATDAEGDALTFSAGTVAAANGTVTINPDGSFTYTPNANFNGTDSFSFKANDGTGDSAQGTITVNVSAVADVPVANAQSITVTEDVAFSGTLTGTDADGDALTFSAGAVAAAHGTVTINPGGSFTYTPNSNFSGTDSFSFKVNDGTTNSADATVSVTVTAVNDVPVANSASITTLEDVPFNGTLTATDADGNSLTFSAGTVAAAHGTVTINPGGTFTYTPNANFNGTDSFSFKVNDGTVNSADATVSVTVTAVSDAPVANSVTLVTPFNTALNGTLTATDPEGDTLTFSAGTVAPTHGTVTINSNGTFLFTPTTGFSGTDTFTFKANDGTSNSAEATVTVVVSPVVNVAPVVINGTGTTDANVAFNGSLSSLATDVNGDALTFSAVTQPTSGTLSLSGDGTFVYTPDAGFSGTDSFTFKANDGLLDSTIATFTITVNASTDLFTLNLSANPGTIAFKKKDVVPLDSSASLINVDPTTNFANATISASIIAGADNHDRFVVTDGGQIDVRGKKIRFNGSEVARISGGRHGSPLQISFNSSATLDSVNAVLQRIGLKTTKKASAGTRTVQFQVSADGFTSSSTIDANV